MTGRQMNSESVKGSELQACYIRDQEGELIAWFQP